MTACALKNNRVCASWSTILRRWLICSRFPTRLWFLWEGEEVVGVCSGKASVSSVSSDESDSSASEDVAVLAEDVDDASRTIRACSTVQTSQRTVRRGSCKIR